MPKVTLKSARPRVDVHWRDAHSPAPATSYSLHEIETLKGFKVMITTGWLLKDVEEAIYIAGEYCPEDDDYRGITIIPRELLIGITKVGVKVKAPTPSTPLVQRTGDAVV